MSAEAVAEVEITLDGPLEREMQGQGGWRFLLTPAVGIARPAERVGTEAPVVPVPLQGFQFSQKRKSSAVFPV